MWILLVAMWAAQNPVYVGTYETRDICERMGYRVAASYKPAYNDYVIADYKCIEVPK